jgi:hypothetical protein
MVLVGIFLLGLTLGRAFGRPSLLVLIGHAAIAGFFIAYGYVRIVMRVEAVRRHLQWHLENPTLRCDSHDK